MDPKQILNNIEGKIVNYSVNNVVDNYKAKDISNPVTIATRDIVERMVGQYQNMLDRTLNGKSNSTGGTGAQYAKVAQTPIIAFRGASYEQPKADYTIVVMANYK